MVMDILEIEINVEDLEWSEQDCELYFSQEEIESICDEIVSGVLL